MYDPIAAAHVDQAITSRRSIRRFLPKPVPKKTVEELLAIASRAPSGTNVQPWKVYALAGHAKDALCAAILDKHNNTGMDGREFDYYPTQWADPWLSRRRKIGLDLYGLLGIGKDDKARMKEQTGRNYLFFDAPVGFIFTMDRQLGRGMFIDYGMFLGNLMTAARARGLDTCAQAAFADYHQTIRQVLGIPENELVVCGMSLGYADWNAKINTLRTDRIAVENFATFRGF